MKHHVTYAPVLLFIILVCLICIIQFLPHTVILPSFCLYSGWFLIMLSVALLLSCKQLFLQYKTPLWKSNPTSLITEHLFKYSRNPICLMQLFLLAGACLLTGNPLSLLAVVVFYYLCNKWIIPMEERLLMRTFGMDYLDYKENVRRWF